MHLTMVDRVLQITFKLFKVNMHSIRVHCLRYEGMIVLWHRRLFEKCGGCEMALATTRVEHEMSLEQEVLAPVGSILEVCNNNV